VLTGRHAQAPGRRDPARGFLDDEPGHHRDYDYYTDPIRRAVSRAPPVNAGGDFYGTLRHQAAAITRKSKALSRE